LCPFPLPPPGKPLREALDNLALLRLFRSRRSGRSASRPTAETLRDLGWDPPGTVYDAACGLALCLPLVEHDSQADAGQRKHHAQFYGDQALALLRTAVARGYKDAAHMQKDTDLDPLRQRDDFQKLLAELGNEQEKQKPRGNGPKR
jgi:hypothetical protein